MNPSPAQGAIRFNREWYCDWDTTNTGDLLVHLAPNCTSGSIVKSTGPGNFSCQTDLDLLTSLDCPPFSIAKWINGAFTCATDLDNTVATVASCSGLNPGYPRFTDALGDFSCLPVYKDKDTARDLLPTCTV